MLLLRLIIVLLSVFVIVSWLVVVFDWMDGIRFVEMRVSCVSVLV